MGAAFSRCCTYISPLSCVAGDTTRYSHQLLAIEVSFYSRDYLPHGAWLRKQDCEELVEIARAHSLLSDEATLAFVPYLYHASELTSLPFRQVWLRTTSLSLFSDHDFGQPPWVNRIPDSIRPWPIRTWRLASDLVGDLAFVLGMLRMPAGETRPLATPGVLTSDYPVWREQTGGVLWRRLPEEQRLSAPTVEVPRRFYYALDRGVFYHHLTSLQLRISELQTARLGRLPAALRGVMSVHGVLGQVQEARVSLLSDTDGRWLEGIILPLWHARVRPSHFRDLASCPGLGTVAFEFIEVLRPMHRCARCGWELFPLPGGKGSTCGRAACSG